MNATHVIILDRPAVFSNLLAEVDPRRGTRAHLPELVEAIEALVCDLARAALKYKQLIRLLLLTRGEARRRGLLRPEQERHDWIPHVLIARRRAGDLSHGDNLARLSEEIAQMRERRPRDDAAWLCDTDFHCWLELWCRPVAMGPLPHALPPTHESLIPAPPAAGMPPATDTGRHRPTQTPGVLGCHTLRVCICVTENLADV